MAITYVAQTSGSAGGTGPNSITYPSTTVDDVILLFVGSGAASITFDTGVDDFTQFYDEVLATDDPRITAAYHVIDGDESSTFDFSTSGGPGSIWWAVAFRGCDTADPIGVIGTAVSNTSSSTTAHGGVTTTANGDFAILYGCASEAESSPSSVDNSFTESVDNTIGSGGSGIAQNGSYKEITTAGAVGTTTITWNGTDRNIAQMFSLNIASSGVTGSVSFDIDVSESLSNELTADLATTFLTDLADNISNQNNSNLAQNIDITLGDTNTNNADKVASFNGSILLNDIEANQLNAVESILYNLNADYFISSQKNVESSLNFNIDLSEEQLNQLISSVSISLNTNLDMTQVGSGAGVINESITFLANLDQSNTNTITIDKAVDLIMSTGAVFDNTANRNELISLLLNISQNQTTAQLLEEAISFDIDLTQTQSNIANRVGLVTLAIALDEAKQTRVDYNLFVNLASSFLYDFTTGGIISDSISFGVQVDESVVNTKDAVEAITLALQAEKQSSLYLVAEGNISFNTQLQTLQTKELIGQTGITFGHLMGLTSIGSADIGEDITFSTIQDLTVEGFVAQFTIVTPNNRTLKVYIEDRTTIVDELERVITVGKT